jgi:hypothetical protein
MWARPQAGDRGVISLGQRPIDRRGEVPQYPKRGKGFGSICGRRSCAVDA